MGSKRKINVQHPLQCKYLCLELAQERVRLKQVIAGLFLKACVIFAL